MHLSEISIELEKTKKCSSKSEIIMSQNNCVGNLCVCGFFMFFNPEKYVNIDKYTAMALDGKFLKVDSILTDYR